MLKPIVHPMAATQTTWLIRVWTNALKSMRIINILIYSCYLLIIHLLYAVCVLSIQALLNRCTFCPKPYLFNHIESLLYMAIKGSTILFNFKWISHWKWLFRRLWTLFFSSVLLHSLYFRSVCSFIFEYKNISVSSRSPYVFLFLNCNGEFYSFFLLIFLSIWTEGKSKK